MAVIKRVTVRQSLINHFKQLLILGELSPGDKLPTENELAQSLSVGRASIREAISAMVSMGLFKKTPEGTFVNDSVGEMAAVSVARVSLITEKGSYHLYEARKVIECGIVPLVVERISDDKLAQLERSIEVSRSLVGKDNKFTQEDVRFHLKLAKIADNEVLYYLMETMSQMIAMQIDQKLNLIAERAGVSYEEAKEHHQLTTIEEHGKIVQGIRNKDRLTAQKSMFEHLDRWQTYASDIFESQ